MFDKLTSHPASALLFIVALASCAGSHEDNNTAVPRQHAYPRVAVYDSIYEERSCAGVSFDINREALLCDGATDSAHATGVNITYDRFNMTVYMTIISGVKSDFNNRLDERLNRVSLNLGSLPAETIPTQSAAGWQGSIIRTRSISATPLQALAYDSDKNTIVTATLFLGKPGTDPDSLAPMIDNIQRDMIHTLSSLK